MLVLFQDCGVLASPLNGVVTYTTTIQDSVATYSCEAGFKIDGFTTRTCSAVTPKGWSDTAPTCIVDSACVSSPCLNGAVCVDQTGGYTCVCSSGYSGDNCQTDTDECASAPCQNEATCVDDINMYTCTCKAGYHGVYCEIEIYECSSNPCLNGGMCNDVTAGYSCTCMPGYQGTHCETEIDECLSSPCQHGTCTEDIGKYSCTCEPGYQGSNCEIDTVECASSPCLNGASCVDLLNHYTCACVQGYDGNHCEINIDDCIDHQCLNGATCIDQIAGYTCTCSEGFIGTYCQDGNAVDECASNPCKNGASCNDLIKHYTCTCPELFAGVNCEAALRNSSSSAALKNLSQIVNAENYDMVLKQTANLTGSDVTTTDGDIIFAMEILQSIASLSVPLNTEELAVAFSIMENVLDSGHEAISVAQKAERTSNRLIQAVDTFLGQLNVSGKNDAVKITTKTMAAAVVEQTGSINSVVGIRMTSASDVSTDAIESVRASSAEGNSDVDVGIELDAALVVNYTTRLSCVVQTNPVLFVEENSTYQVNSMVVSATLKRDGENVEKLNNNKVWVTLKITEQNTLPLCGYWDTEENQGYGGWRTDGCSVVEHDSSSHVICSCNHLTNFAVLMDPRNNISPLHKFILGVISKVGLGLSIAALSITIVSFLAFKKLRAKDHQKVLLNLSVAMFCYSVIFLAGIDKTGSRSGCVTVAALLHYFILASFMWMLVEAVQLYINLVLVFAKYNPTRFIVLAMIFAWGLPTLPVIFILAYDRSIYFDDHGYCWMERGPLTFAFIIPVALILAINLFIFLIITTKLCMREHKKLTQKQKNRRQFGLIGGFAMFILLGLTWIFGFLTVDDTRLVFHYLFAICNSMLGFLIFVLFIARRGETLKQWHDLCCKRKFSTKISTSDTWVPKRRMHSESTRVSFGQRQLTQVEKPGKRARFYEGGM
ncbi:adhesion G protein-coupled receptor L4-like [Mya arenaria]|uniref:adhesion G protein-coupled receptor L4-like n=1 Tax=Mya arenaria TaxID=6604 RepID=UPI0022E68CD2|nr:adhesion G protein-coupled receptor L4-like [Mya arenaria]